MIQLCGLWRGTTKDGRSYLGGNLGFGARLLIFKNDRKTEDKQPDYNVLIVENERRDNAEPAQPTADPATAPHDDIPF